MNEQEIMDVISYLADEAADHRPHYSVKPDIYATGTPPAGWRDKAVRFARSLGYELRYGWEPVEKFGEGCDGYTCGYDPPWLDGGSEDHTITIVPGLMPAQEFAVTAHELAHAYLRHPPQDEDQVQVLLFLAQMGAPKENFAHEVSAHLAAIAAAAAAGLSVHQSSKCYLASRVHDHRKPIGEDERYAAFLAGRAIAKALA